MAYGVSVGGAKWGDARVEPFVRRLLGILDGRLRKLRAKGRDSAAEAGTAAASDADDAPGVSDEAVKRVSTFVSGTIASLVAISLLQSSPAYARPRFGATPPDVSASPYPSFVDAPSPTGPAFLKPPAVQSPTLDLTLFVLVRAVDTLVRTIYEYTGPSTGHAGAAVQFVATHADTLVFQLSCWKIMWCWFYQPELLNPSYARWISQLARLDRASFATTGAPDRC